MLKLRLGYPTSGRTDAARGSLWAGKSTVSTLLQAHGIPLVDLDVLAREAVAPNSYALSALAKHFGPSILLADGTLDRAALGAIVFADDKQRRVLNSITHPAVRRLLAWELVKAWLRGDKVCVVDAPLLIEAGLWKFCGSIIVVYWSVLSPRERPRRPLTPTCSPHAIAARKHSNYSASARATASPQKRRRRGSGRRRRSRPSSSTPTTSLTTRGRSQTSPRRSTA